MAKKPWGGRFKKSTAQSTENFTASIHFDNRLYDLDIAGSIAHVTMLAKQKIMTKMEALKIINGLKNIRKDIQEGKFKLDMADEDIHMAIEKELMKRIGEVGGKLHTARSRNDQVVLDTRLFYEWRSKNSFSGYRPAKGTGRNCQERNQDDYARIYPFAEGATGLAFALSSGFRGDV